MDDRESVILSEVREGEIPYDIHYVWELLEMIHMKLLIKQTHRLRKRTYGCWGKGQWGLWECHVHTAIFKMDNQQAPIVQHTEICSVLCASLDGSEVEGRMNTCIRMAESLHCSPETTTTL